VLRRRSDNPLATALLEDRFRGASGVRIEPAGDTSTPASGALRFLPLGA
jgi:hypothetical protein